MILGYARCSTAEQVLGTSMAEQERQVRGFAMMRGAHNAYDVLVFTDPGVSGATPLAERPAGRDLLAQAGRDDVVVASKLDRMFRSALDALQVAKGLKAKGIDLVLLDMGNTPVTDGGMAQCFFAMAAAFAELERERIADRMQSGRDAKRRQGGHLGGQAPYGFRVTGTGKAATLEPVEAERRVLEAVADLVRRDMPPYRAAQELTRQGLLTRTQKPFHTAQVQRMMRRIVAEVVQ